MNLSVIIPVYNEVESIKVILGRVQDTKLAKEIIVVDDGSTDGTREVLRKLDGKRGIHVLLHPRNKGKG
ncbi:MAG TPA: glycosyltransferase, partial [Anaerolineales bacterium]|nr:glycosyltransferase [Anaerolineales bacterium]